MQIIDLGGKWQLQKNGKGKSISATVPGELYNDLLTAGEIPDPFYRDQEINCEHIWKDDWQYSRTFSVTQAMLKSKRIILRCEGLDTLAMLSINGKRLASTDNMFRTWEFDLKKYLKSGSNKIEIYFSSAFNYCEHRDKTSKRTLYGWGRNMGLPTQFAWMRKSPCNFGWDWGAKTITCGIWRDIKIIATDTPRIESVNITQQHAKGKPVKLNIACATDISAKACNAKATLTFAGKTIATEESKLARGKTGISLSVEKPQLWWPNNMGEQPLYDLCVELIDENGNIIDTNHKRIGLRVLKLERKKDQWGESFNFSVNGVPFFAKGGNWIPVDAIMGRRTREDYQRLIADCARANMNMLRVWGGGIYEDDCFYDICDELGICVWQDFIFACSTYPAYDKQYMKNVAAEATDNVRRIRHHACLALLCGNNEMEQGLVKEKWSEKSMSWTDYKKLFDQLLPKVVKDEAPYIDYWPGSPHSSTGDRSDHRNPQCGDAHLWDVWHGQKPFEWYRTCEHRFNSEFGFQSFPQPSVVNTYTNKQDRNVTTRIMEHHQRSGIGNTTIMRYMLDWFRLPTSFESLLWLSQILQGMAIKYAVEHWRRSMPRGMGTLYWQINDEWPVASWSSIDYYGNWKALQYMAKDFFNPVLLSGVENIEKGTVEVHLGCDNLKAVGGKLEWNIYDLSGKVITCGSKNVRSGANASKLVHTLKLQKELEKYEARNIIVLLEFTDKKGNNYRNLVLFARPKHMELSQSPKISLRVIEDKNSPENKKIYLKTQKPALWCWLEVPGAKVSFERNFNHLLPKKELEFTCTSKLSAKQLKEKIVIKSLVDTYC